MVPPALGVPPMFVAPPPVFRGEPVPQPDTNVQPVNTMTRPPRPTCLPRRISEIFDIAHSRLLVGQVGIAANQAP
jgi:hypothetical protein